MSKKANLFDLAISFLKIGTIGFGGGSALIPVVEKEVVEEKQWIDDEKYIEHTVAANITPGALPVKLGAASGKTLLGPIGAIIGGISTAIPGVILTVTLVALISVLGSDFVKYIEDASVGISLFIILLLFLYINKVMRAAEKSGIYIRALIIMLFAFIATSGKEIRQVYSIFAGVDFKTLSLPIFDISTLDLMIASFFLIFFMGNRFNKFKLIYGTLITYIFVDLSGKTGILPKMQNGKLIIYIIMLLSIVISIRYDKRKEEKNEKVKMTFDKSAMKAIFAFVAFGIIISIITIILVPQLTKDAFPEINGNQNIFQYIINVIVSTFTSFGGGEAYVSVADGFFIQTGFVDPSIFYSRIIGIANALPGPILVKVAAGIGYSFAFAATKSVFAGYLVAILGMVLSVSASCIGVILVLAAYDALKDSPILESMKLYILPVVCGMLITTSLSMYYEALKITALAGAGSVISTILFLILFGVMFIMHKKYKIHDVVVIIGSAALNIFIFTFI